MELAKYWRQFPPLHILVKEYLGYEGPKEDTMERVTASTNNPPVSQMAGMNKLTSRTQLPKHVQDAYRIKREGKLEKLLPEVQKVG